MCHYTWGTLVEENKKEIWIFDKRKYTAPELELEVRRWPYPSLAFLLSSVTFSASC